MSLRKAAGVLLAFAMLASLGAGCAAKEVSAEEIRDNILEAAASKLDIVSLNMDMTMNIDVTGGKEPAKVNVVATGAGYQNSTTGEMQFSLDMEMEAPVMGKVKVPMETYLVDGWMYIKMTVPQMGTQWLKMKLDDELWAKQDQVAQQMEFLKTATQITRLPDETVNGIDSYVLKVDPDMNAMRQWVLSQQTGQTGLDLSKVDLASMFKSFSVTEWVAKGSYQPMRSEVTATMEMKPEDFGETSDGQEKLTMQMTAKVTYSDWGKVKTIELPPEALDAQELPSL